MDVDVTRLKNASTEEEHSKNNPHGNEICTRKQPASFGMQPSRSLFSSPTTNHIDRDDLENADSNEQIDRKKKSVEKRQIWHSWQRERHRVGKSDDAQQGRHRNAELLREVIRCNPKHAPGYNQHNHQRQQHCPNIKRWTAVSLQADIDLFKLKGIADGGFLLK